MQIWAIIALVFILAAIAVFIIYKVGFFRSLLGFTGWTTLGVIAAAFLYSFIYREADVPPAPAAIEAMPAPEEPDDAYKNKDPDYNEERFAESPPSRSGETRDNERRQVAKRPPCAVLDTCRVVKVLYGTSRRINYDIPAEQDGDYADNDLTPFLDEYDGDREDASLGFILVTVPERARPDDNEVFRPREPNRVERWFHIGPRLDGAKHYIFRDYDELSEQEFASELADKKRAFVYIHGYQEPLITAAFRAAQIKVVGGFDGQAAVFSWPSINGLSEDNYFEARRNAVRSGEKLKGFLNLITENLDADEVHIIAHSMGNYALLEALDSLETEGVVENGAPFDQVIMAAPDVSMLEYVRLIEDVRSLARGATLYASRNDVALRASRTACERRRKTLLDKSPNLTDAEMRELETLICDNRAGYVPKPPNDIPVLADGVAALDVSYVDRNTWLEGIAGLHGYAFEDPQVFFDIGAVMDPLRRAPIDKRGQLVCLTESNTYCENADGAEERKFWRFY